MQIIDTELAIVTVTPASIKGRVVDRMVVFLPNFSSATPPISPPSRAARGIMEPIHEACESVTEIVDWSDCSEAIAGDDHAEV